MNKLYVIFFFINLLGFSQNLEETIYRAAETFINNESETAFILLNSQESNFKSLAKTKDEQLALVFLQSHKGYYLTKQSKLKEAISTYEDAINRYKKNELERISNFDITENCLKPLGNLYTQTNDYTSAINTINQYIYLAEQNKNNTQSISGAINLAKLYYTIGKHNKVFETVKKFINHPKISETQKQKLLQINIDSQIENNTISGYEDIGISSKTDKASTFLNNYKIELKKGNYSNALKAFKRYKTHSQLDKKTPRELAQIYIEESQLYFLLKNKDKALKALRVAINKLIPEYHSNNLPSNALLYSENKFIDIFDLYAEYVNDPFEALNSYNLSFHVANLLKENWTTQETKIVNESNNRIKAEKCIDILFDLHKQTNKKDYLKQALQYSEDHKASTLNSITLKKIRLKNHPNDSLLIKELKLKKSQEKLIHTLIQEQLSKNRTSKINETTTLLSQLSYELKQIKSKIALKYFNQKQTIPFESLNSKLKNDNAAIIEYFYGENNIYQFIVAPNLIQLHRIPLNSEKEKSILQYVHLFDNSSIINNNIPNFSKLAFDLYQTLNLNAVPKNKNVIIIPDGLINFVPFESVLTKETNSLSFSKMPFWVFDKNIAYNTNIFLYINSTNKNNSQNTLGFFPVFENSNQTLKYSIDEAEIVKSEMTSDLFMHDKATKSNFIEHASSYNVLHLSTHANGGNSSTAASISFFNETMTINEIYSLDLNANLAVLSACETGVGIRRKGEGPMSIARGFQYAGVQNLLISLWQINDLTTSLIMQRFYKKYNKGKSAFQANHQSKLDYLNDKSINNIKKSPYYWSAFVYYGALTPANSPDYSIYFLIGSLFVLVIVLLILKKLKIKHDRNDTTKLPS